MESGNLQSAERESQREEARGKVSDSGQEGQGRGPGTMQAVLSHAICILPFSLQRSPERLVKSFTG